MNLITKLGQYTRAATYGVLAVAIPVVGIGVAYSGCIAVDAGIRASLEGIERMCGSQTKEHIGKLKSNKRISMLGTHGEFTEGTFTLQDGREIVISDLPVVTEGKYWPGMGRLQEGQTYKVTAFEGFGTPRFVNAEKIN